MQSSKETNADLIPNKALLHKHTYTVLLYRLAPQTHIQNPKEKKGLPLVRPSSPSPTTVGVVAPGPDSSGVVGESLEAGVPQARVGRSTPRLGWGTNGVSGAISARIGGEIVDARGRERGMADAPSD